VLELVDQRVANPWFYPQARRKGLPAFAEHYSQGSGDVSAYVVVFNERIGSRDLFHGLVHAAQLQVLGVAEVYRVVRARIFAGEKLFSGTHESACICTGRQIRGESGCATFQWKTKFAPGGDREGTNQRRLQTRVTQTAPTVS